MPIVAYEDELAQIDFRQQALALGIDMGGAHWMELDADDLRALHLALTKPLLADGRSVASEFPMLRMLAAWAKAAEPVAREVAEERKMRAQEMRKRM
jgi:hypothetical protein